AESGILNQSARSAAEVLGRLTDIRDEFRRGYERMLRAVAAVEKPAAVCTVYDAIPGLDPRAVTALALFNDVILRAAFAAVVPVIDLRLVCTAAADYSGLSPIEPSRAGGAKIARAVAALVAGHDFRRRQSVVYS